MRPTKVEGPKVTIAAGLVLAEFDIDTGSCMRACYPKQIATVNVPSAEAQTGVATKPVNLNLKLYEQYFANHMLPDGAEKLTVGRTVFVVNRPRLPAYVRLPIYRFTTAASLTAESTDGAAHPWTRLVSTHASDPLTPELLLLDSQSGEVAFRRHDQPLTEPCLVPLEDYITVSPVPAELEQFERQLQQRAATAELAANPAGSRKENSPAPMPGISAFVFVMINRDVDDGASRHGFFIAAAHHRSLMDTLTQALAPRSQPTPDPNPEPSSDPTAAEASEQQPVEVSTEVTVASLARQGAAAHGSHASSSHHSSGSESSSQREGPDDGTHAEVVAIEDDVPAGVDAPTDVVVSALPADGPVNTTAEEFTSPLHAGPDMPDMPVASPVSEVSNGVGDVDATSTASGTAQLVLPGGGGSTTSGFTAQQEVGDGLTGAAMTLQDGEVERALAGDAAAAAVVFGNGYALYGLCAVVSKRDSSARRGGITKSVALLGPSLAWLDAFFPILVEAARYCCDIRGSDADAVQQQTQVLKMCLETINKASPVVTAGLTRMSQLATEVSKFATYSSDSRQLFAEVREAPFGTQHKLKIPLSPASHDIRFNRYSLEGMIEALGPAFMHLVQAVLTEKKIVVLSRQGLSTDVCEAALSIGLIGNLIDPHFMEKKVFPYTSINAAESFLNVPGYVLGTLNPIFENERHFHWDVLCDLDSRTLTFSGAEKKRGATAALAANWSSATAELANAVGVGEDPAFKSLSPQATRLFKQLSACVYRTRALRLPPPERNRRLRLLLEEHVQLTAAMVFLVDSDTNLPPSLASLPTDPAVVKTAAQMQLTSFADAPLQGLLFPGEPPEVLLTAAALRHCQGCNASAMKRLLQNVLALLAPSDERVLLLLRRMPVALSGLDPIGYQLTHPASSVQAAAFAVLKRIESVPLGKAAISAMSNYLVMAYENVVIREKQRAFYSQVS